MLTKFYAILLILTATLAWGEESTDLRNPAARYIRANPDVRTLSYWKENIILEVSGEVPAYAALRAVSLLRTLSEHASTKLKMSGVPESWFALKDRVGSDANYVILFDDMASSNVANAAMFYGKDTNVNMDSAKPEVRQLFEAGIPRDRKGCYGFWKITSNNVIQVFVLVIDSGMPSEFQEACIDVIVPSSLGVYPIVTTLNLSGTGKTVPRGDPNFYDKSEIILLLRLSAYCRNTLNDYSAECPAGPLSSLYEHHMDLLNN